MGLIKRSWIWVLVILVVAGVFAAFRLSKKTDPDYFTAKVEKGDIRQVIEATGTINPVTSVQVGSQVSGMISKLYVDFNSKVTKGQVIAEIDPKLFQGAVLQAQADLQNSQALLAAAKANLTKDQATLQQNKLDYDRAVALQREAVNSQQQLDQAKATYDAITAQVGSDRAAIQQAEAQIAQKTATLRVAQTNLDYTIIRAPINGTVVARNIDIGQTVAASLQAPTLFMIALDLTKMQVYAKTDEGDVGQIRPGQKADFQVDAFPKEMFHGVVFQVRMNATSIQNVVTYDTIVNFDNPELKLFPGMTAYVSIPVASVNDVIKVPNAALRYKPDLPVEKVQELYRKYAVAVTAPAPAAKQPGATGRERPVPKPNGATRSETAVVWKLLPDKSLRPVQIHIGLTDHTYTALTAGDLQPGEELVTGATTAKQESAGPGLTPQRR
ncbi:MAG TPA: efflux RND transporter periplasmic adaptor subunit [Candidatus Sulfotelmatobacter sp.]|nr:efflux RND transporter periplasmic adaptor subunit [Candidatus Sulfotelmatobacter sp.]